MDVYVMAIVMSSLAVPDNNSEFASFFTKRTQQLFTPTIQLSRTFPSLEDCRNQLKAHAFNIVTNPKAEKLSDDGFYKVDGVFVEFRLDPKYPSITATKGSDGQATDIEHHECAKLSVSE